MVQHKSPGLHSAVDVRDATAAPAVRRLSLGTDLCNIAVARRFVRDAVRDAVATSRPVEPQPTPLADLELLTSELVANALIHTHSDVHLEVRCTAERARVAVRDRDPSTPRVNGLRSQETSGRGLAIVNALAADWGFRVADHEKVVWFEIDLRDRPRDTPEV